MATTDVNSLFVKGISKHFGLEYAVLDRKADDIFHVQTTKSRYEDMQGWQTYGLFESRQPGEVVKQDSFKENYAKRLVIVNYGLGDSVPFEDWKDDQYGVYSKMLPAKGGGLARAWNVTRERIAAGYFINLAYASGTSVSKSPDGVALISTSHPQSRLSAATLLANRPTNEINLSYAAIVAAKANMRKQKAANGVEMLQNKIRALVYNPDYDAVAQLICTNQYEPYSSDRNKNTLLEDRITPIPWAYFEKSGATGTNNAWFVVGEEHSLYLFEREDFEMYSQEDITTLSYIFAATARMEVGHADWRGTYGSVGE